MLQLPAAQKLSFMCGCQTQPQDDSGAEMSIGAILEGRTWFLAFSCLSDIANTLYAHVKYVLKFLVDFQLLVMKFQLLGRLFYPLGVVHTLLC